MNQLTMFPPLTDGEEDDLVMQVKEFEAFAKQKRNWENAFQRWSDKVSQDGTSPLGCCGYSVICDYCKDNDKGRPCVRALNEWLRAKRKRIDYTKREFEEVWSGDV